MKIAIGLRHAWDRRSARLRIRIGDHPGQRPAANDVEGISAIGFDRTCSVVFRHTRYRNTLGPLALVTVLLSCDRWNASATPPVRFPRLRKQKRRVDYRRLRIGAPFLLRLAWELLQGRLDEVPFPVSLYFYATQPEFTLAAALLKAQRFAIVGWGLIKQ